MTKLQKYVTMCLLEGGNIATLRVRDKNHNPLRRIQHRTFSILKSEFLVKRDEGWWVIDVSAIEKMRNNNWVKRKYIDLTTTKNN